MQSHTKGQEQSQHSSRRKEDNRGVEPTDERLGQQQHDEKATPAVLQNPAR